jgi:GntR family transcriptional regulator
MNLDLDPSSPVPIYLQIVEQVRRLVALGALRAGEQLPTVREVAARSRVNRNTVARAYEVLEGQGIVHGRVGQGTFVAEDAPRLDPVRRDGALDEVLDRVIVEARSLGVPLAELGKRLSRRIEAFEKEARKESAGKEPKR